MTDYFGVLKILIAITIFIISVCRTIQAPPALIVRYVFTYGVFLLLFINLKVEVTGD
ncbi:MAG: hypothetical protein ACI8XG_000155 [Congregibacter sp.]|jgi:hypothetical protein